MATGAETSSLAPSITSSENGEDDKSSESGGGDGTSIDSMVLSADDLMLNFCPSEPPYLWKKLSSCEEFVGAKRSKHTIVAYNDRIYVFGGDDGRRMLNDFLVSHIRDSSWARVVYTGEYCCT